MSNDSETPVNANDLLQQHMLSGSARASKPAPRHAFGTIAGEGVRDTDELLRLVSLIKQAEAASGAVEKMVVIGEFSVTAARVPDTFITGLKGLTRAEAAVLRMLGWGRANADIAMLLDSNENTVRTHMNNVIRKIELDGMRDLIALAGLLFHPLD